jgi:hypothetical protein
MDGVKRDGERLGIRNWRTKAMDRDGWSKEGCREAGN